VFDPLPTPAPRKEDARNRALRTFFEGLIGAAITALVAALPTVLANPQWTGAYWLGVGIALGTVILSAIVAYVARFLVPPRTT
jgi:uncharacterized membrane protein